MDKNNFNFYTTVRVRYADTDAQGHVYFSNYFVYFDIATTDYMKAIGYSYERLLDEGYDFFTVEALCQYKNRAFFDEELKVFAKISKLGNSSFTYELAIYRDQTLIANGHIVNVMIDRETRKPIRIPDSFREAVSNFESLAKL